MAQMPAEECARPVKHKQEDCMEVTEVTEVTVKLPVVDTNAIEILSHAYCRNLQCVNNAPSQQVDLGMFITGTSIYLSLTHCQGIGD